MNYDEFELRAIAQSVHCVCKGRHLATSKGITFWDSYNI